MDDDFVAPHSSDNDDRAVRDVRNREWENDSQTLDLVSENDALDRTNKGLTDQLNGVLKEFSDIEESFKEEQSANRKSKNAAWFVSAVLVLVAVVATTFGFNKESERSTLENTLKNGNSSESEQLNRLRSERDEASAKLDQLNGQIDTYRSTADEQRARAEKAEQEIKKRDKEIEELKKKSDSSSSSRSTTTSRSNSSDLDDLMNQMDEDRD